MPNKTRKNRLDTELELSVRRKVYQIYHLEMDFNFGY